MIEITAGGLSIARCDYQICFFECVCVHVGVWACVCVCVCAFVFVVCLSLEDQLFTFLIVLLGNQLEASDWLFIVCTDVCVRG